MTVSGLFVYPIKSCRGTALTQAALDARGIVGDRSLMLVDGSGRFLSQRTFPAMATIVPELWGDRLVVAAPSMPPLEMVVATAGEARPVIVWRDTCDAVDQGDEAAAWFSAFLKTDCRLVAMADGFQRPLDPDYARTADDRTGFSDGYPLLLIGEESLAELNTRLETPLPMERFRPNLVVSGSSPYAEDTWHRVRIGDVACDIVKPCARCAIPTIDQQTGILGGDEPLRTLATYRRWDQRPAAIVFGQNVIHSAPGVLRVGDRVAVV
jgi:uncharacterized protein YcbX